MGFCCVVIYCFIYVVYGLDLSNWMGNKSDILWDQRLNELTLLGTHDSGAYNLTRIQIYDYEPEWIEAAAYIGEEIGLPVEDVITLWGQSQPKNIYYQMLYGSRYIDMRCAWIQEKNNWYTEHWEAGNDTIQTLSNNINQFIMEHPTEIVLIETGSLDGYQVNNEKLSGLLNIFKSTFKDLLYPRPNTSNNIFPTYGDMISQNKRVIVSIPNNIVYDDGNENIWYGNMYQNTYANSDNVTYMMEFNDKQVSIFNNNETNPNALFKISWTLTPQTDTVLKMELPDHPHNLIELAQIANKEMQNWTSIQFEKNLKIGNIFLYDDYTTSAIQYILNQLYH